MSVPSPVCEKPRDYFDTALRMLHLPLSQVHDTDLIVTVSKLRRLIRRECRRLAVETGADFIELYKHCVFCFRLQQKRRMFLDSLFTLPIPSDDHLKSLLAIYIRMMVGTNR